MSSTELPKQIILPGGAIVPADDCYRCPECGFTWGGEGRPPPYPHCPDCGDAMMHHLG